MCVLKVHVKAPFHCCKHPLQTYGFSLASPAIQPWLPLSFYSEQSFYFSFFVRAAAAPSLPAAVATFFTADGSVEAPDTVLPFQRFNLLPELLGAVLYKTAAAVVPAAAMPDPVTFQLHVVWASAGLQVAGLVVLAARLAGSRGASKEDAPSMPLRRCSSAAAGALAVVCFLGVFKAATRVQSNPMLRETFALGVLWFQTAALCGVLTDDAPSQRVAFRLRWRLLLLTATVMLCWQFAAFIFLLQAAAAAATHLLCAASEAAVRSVLWTMLAVSAAAAVAMCGNTMLLSSLLVAFCTACLAALRLCPALPVTPPPSGWRVASRAVRVVATTTLLMVAVKAAAGAVVDDDAHVFDLLHAKMSDDAATFDTMMYLCGAAYRGLPSWVTDLLTSSSVLPVGTAVGALIMAAAAVRHPFARADRVFFVLCTALCGVLGTSIMRLMMLFIVPLCVLAGAVAAPEFAHEALGFAVPCIVQSPRVPAKPSRSRRRQTDPDSTDGLRRWLWVAIVPLLALVVATAAWQHIRGHWTAATAGPTGVWHGLTPFVPLMQALRQQAGPDDVVCASPVVSSAVLLTFAAHRPAAPSVAVHPHAENGGMRLRYRRFYSMYSRLDEADVHRQLAAHLGCTLAVVDFLPCDSKCLDGYSYADIAAKGLPQLGYNATMVRTASNPRRLQWCYAVTETPQRTIKAVFQNDRFLLLRLAAPGTTWPTGK